jgi:hypothetical protein
MAWRIPRRTLKYSCAASPSMAMELDGAGARDNVWFSYTIRTRPYCRGVQTVSSLIQGLMRGTDAADAKATLRTVQRDLTALLEDVHHLPGRTIYGAAMDLSRVLAAPELAPTDLAAVLYVPTRLSPAAYDSRLLRRLARGAAPAARADRRRRGYALDYRPVRLQQDGAWWWLLDPNDAAAALALRQVFGVDDQESRPAPQRACSRT